MLKFRGLPPTSVPHAGGPRGTVAPPQTARPRLRSGLPMQRVWELWDLPQMVTQCGASIPDSQPTCLRTVPTCAKSLRPGDVCPPVTLSRLCGDQRGSQCSGLLLSRLAWLQKQNIPAHTFSHWYCCLLTPVPSHVHTVPLFFCRHLVTQPSRAVARGFHIITLEMCFKEELTHWNEPSQSPSLPEA